MNAILYVQIVTAGTMEELIEDNATFVQIINVKIIALIMKAPAEIDARIINVKIFALFMKVSAEIYARIAFALYIINTILKNAYWCVLIKAACTILGIIL